MFRTQSSTHAAIEILSFLINFAFSAGSSNLVIVSPSEKLFWYLIISFVMYHSNDWVKIIIWQRTLMVSVTMESWM